MWWCFYLILRLLNCTAIFKQAKYYEMIEDCIIKILQARAKKFFTHVERI